MHIAFLTPEYPHTRVTKSAGIGTSIKNLVTGLVHHKHQVSIFVFGQKENVVLFEGDIKIHLIKHKTYKLLGWYFQRKSIQNYLNSFIVSDKIQAIEAPDWAGITAFMTLKCPIVIRCHGTDAYFCKLENRFQKKKNFLVEKSALKKANHIVSVSRFNAVETKAIFNLKQPIDVIHNGVDTNVFRPPTATQAASILYFGSIIRKKGVLEIPDILNKVVSQFPKMTFKIAGKDVIDYKEQQSTWTIMKSKMSKELLDSTQFLGELSYQDIQAELAKASIVILPSFAEAFPMTWLEAMAMEKALVTSNIGWAKELMIHHKTGFMANPKDHDSYTYHILQLLNHEHLRHTFGQNARTHINNNFSIEVITAQNIDYYKTIVS